MYRKLPRSTDNILGYEITGPLEPGEAQAIAGDVGRAIAAQGSPRMLIDLRNFPYDTPDALWEDLKFGEHLERLERIVLIGDADWEDVATRAVNAVCGAECRFFSRREVDEAWEWITLASSRLPQGLASEPTSAAAGR
jgi:SpoIIAA-like